MSAKKVSLPNRFTDITIKFYNLAWNSGKDFDGFPGFNRPEVLLGFFPNGALLYERDVDRNGFFLALSFRGF